jgi:hypothetical protein
LATRNTGVLAALTERRVDWADRWVFTRIARAVLPELVGRNVPGWALTMGAGALALLSLMGIGLDWQGVGLIGSLTAAAALATASAMAALRGEELRGRALEWAILALFGAVVLLCGWVEHARLYSWTPMVFAAFGLAAQVLIERAPSRHRRWWASPSAHLLLLMPFTLAGFTEFGLAGIAVYAFATLTAAVEATREKSLVSS